MSQTIVSTLTLQSKIINLILNDDLTALKKHKLLSISNVYDIYGNNVLQMAYLSGSSNIFNYILHENNVYGGHDLVTEQNHRNETLLIMCMEKHDVSTTNAINIMVNEKNDKYWANLKNEITTVKETNKKLVTANDRLQTANEKMITTINELKNLCDSYEFQVDDLKKDLKRKSNEHDDLKKAFGNLQKISKK